MAGKVVIISAPSGAGKTTIVHHLLQQEKLALSFSISACSRDARPNETAGKDYYFLGVEGFKKAISNNEFLEWEEVYPNQFYGTLQREVDRIWNEGKTVIFDVDVVGGLNLKKKFKDQALAVFIQPPHEKALEERLRSRQTESEEKIQLRIGKAKEELSRASEFDTIIVNDNLEEAFNEAEEVIANFLKR
ncbi:MAG: guanylate kinase [Crocinitomicaceae bacterium]|nr:guanylate kinase [Crocinitomicaceae bacterium]|tara:strand:+ start:33 stop:602 length:570 start_codon:yes stop_codon:yes gene_type:complete